MATKKKSTSRAKKKPTNNSVFHSPYAQLCVGVGLIALALYTAACDIDWRKALRTKIEY